MAVLRPLEGRHRELPRRPRRGDGRRQQPRGCVGRHAQACRSRESSTSSRTTSGRIRRRSSSGWRRDARCGSATPTSSPARDVVKDDAGAIVELRCTYDPATRGGDAPDGRKVKATLHWVSARARGRRPRCASTTGCSTSRCPAARRRGLPGADQPALTRGRRRLQARALAGRRSRRAAASSSSASATSRADLDSTPAASGVQPHRDAQGHLEADRTRLTRRRQETGSPAWTRGPRRPGLPRGPRGPEETGSPARIEGARGDRVSRVDRGRPRRPGLPRGPRETEETGSPARIEGARGDRVSRVDRGRPRRPGLPRGPRETEETGSPAWTEGDPVS